MVFDESRKGPYKSLFWKLIHTTQSADIYVVIYYSLNLSFDSKNEETRSASFFGN